MQKARSTPGCKGKGKATAGKKRGNKADKEEEGAEDSEECPEDAVKSDESDDDSDREVSSATPVPLLPACSSLMKATVIRTER